MRQAANVLTLEREKLLLKIHLEDTLNFLINLKEKYDSNWSLHKKSINNTSSPFFV